MPSAAGCKYMHENVSVPRAEWDSEAPTSQSGPQQPPPPSFHPYSFLPSELKCNSGQQHAQLTDHFPPCLQLMMRSFKWGFWEHPLALLLFQFLLSPAWSIDVMAGALAAIWNQRERSRKSQRTWCWYHMLWSNISSYFCLQVTLHRWIAFK